MSITLLRTRVFSRIFSISSITSDNSESIKKVSQFRRTFECTKNEKNLIRENYPFKPIRGKREIDLKINFGKINSRSVAISSTGFVMRIFFSLKKRRTKRTNGEPREKETCVYDRARIDQLCEKTTCKRVARTRSF